MRHPWESRFCPSRSTASIPDCCHLRSETCNGFDTTTTIPALPRCREVPQQAAGLPPCSRPVARRPSCASQLSQSARRHDRFSLRTHEGTPARNNRRAQAAVGGDEDEEARELLARFKKRTDLQHLIALEIDAALGAPRPTSPRSRRRWRLRSHEGSSRSLGPTIPAGSGGRGSSGILISYRSEDLFYASRLRDGLMAQGFFNHVFMDVTSVALGRLRHPVTSIDAVNETLDLCGVVLALIGPGVIRRPPTGQSLRQSAP